MGTPLVVVPEMAQGGLLALHTQQVLVGGQHDVPGQNKPSTSACLSRGGGRVATPKGMGGAHVAKKLAQVSHGCFKPPESLNFPTVNAPCNQLPPVG